MWVALIKLADTAARSLFVLIVLYTLQPRSTGQFGLALTLIGVFSFLYGFERYIDVQRRIVNQEAAAADRMLLQTLSFYGANYLLWGPLLIALLLLWVELDWVLALSCLLISIGEHLSNEIYRFVLVLGRHRGVLVSVLTKNVVLLVVVAPNLFLGEAGLALRQILWTWAGVSVLALGVAALIFVRGTAAAASVAAAPFAEHFRASRTHFMIGIVALLALQADRLVVGGLLTLEQSGIYFRHIFVASFIYQIFNVASYNRIAPRVYGHVMGGRHLQGRATVRQEIRIFVPLTLLFIAALAALRPLELPLADAAASVSPRFLAILTFAFLVRATADYNALLLNSVFRERDTFIAQLTAVSAALLLSLVLTRELGMTGTAVALIAGSAIYLAASTFYVRRQPQFRGVTPNV